MALKKKRKLKFRVKKIKNEKSFKDFNLSEIDLFLKIKGYTLEQLKRKKEQVKLTEEKVVEETN